MREHAREFSSARHILATIKATAKTMVIAALCCAIVGITAIEIYGYAATATVSLATHVLAVVVGLVCAYGAIVTVLLRGVIETLVDSVELVVTEVERLTNSIVHQAETVEGTMFHHDDERDGSGYREGVRERETVRG
jgi:hypothetical protein